MITINIETGNDAFYKEQYGDAVARILYQIAHDFEGNHADDPTGKRVKETYNDYNGNKVCTVEVTTA